MKHSDPCFLLLPSNNSPCLVKGIEEVCFEKLSNIFPIYVSSGQEKEITSLLGSYRKSVFLIAHSQLSNFSFISGFENKRANWWNLSNTFLFAYSCESRTILKNKDWESKFNDWVGSTSPIWHSLERGSLEILGLFFLKVANEILTFTKNIGESIIHKIPDLYWVAYYESLKQPDINKNSIELYRLSVGKNKNSWTCKSKSK